MSYKTLLVHLDASARSRVRLSIALRLARTFGSHLDGLFATFSPDPRGFYVMAGTADYFEQHRQLHDEHRDAIERLFRAELAQSQVPGNWRDASDDPVEHVVQHARAADLVIVGQSDPGDPEAYVAERFPETVVMSAGTPVLVVPNEGEFATVGERVLIGWNGSRESARALHDAMPLLARAARVTIAGVSGAVEAPHAAMSCDDVAAALARHRVTNLDLVEFGRNLDETAGDALLSYATRGGYDLIVTGAYGHTRWQEMVLGGATQTMFDLMTVPVLMSH
ncbi:universal stress protein [Paraburkholderia caballeronis]|uniref:Nucleotide-binding universal stress protein, UspA family n=1 Tax=Paraburkholderia caballeronis TaxID=416943 RepID=A0A1H7P9W1_9BURK|nr:universal stress protein [Paraburkholderia caballeronis]PXW25343.1 nucleotide-binding universal stress UspA family protein [Paraburkholderia caballeronis]PXX00950.1 nucleotide-binding universal stress UspA family protein [Paraburkholderia caballeronis]RAJ99697.1 nucleotide-binding universal stress UspA family protein [Paraburkholderia caballeronis]TDV03510.1 nucleotide-binding universal stress UspA family protein [Paraburkholderia caballeronis]TDV08401.1 nucleotide-binding universal stress 